VKTYRQLFAVAQFRVLFLSQCLMVMSGSVASLALGTIMYAATGSPLLTGLSMFGGPLVRLFGSSFLLALSDTLRPRQAMIVVDLTIVVSSRLQAVPDLARGWRFILIAVPWLVMSATAGTSVALMSDILPLAVPYLGFGLAPSVSLACLLVFVASVGFAASLPLQERLITHTDASKSLLLACVRSAKPPKLRSAGSPHGSLPGMMGRCRSHW